MGRGGQDRQYNHVTGYAPNADGQFSEEPSSILSGVSIATAELVAATTLTLTAPPGGTIYLSQVMWTTSGANAVLSLADSEGTVKAIVGTIYAATASPADNQVTVNFNPPLNCGTNCVATGAVENFTNLTLNGFQQLNTNNE